MGHQYQGFDTAFAALIDKYDNIRQKFEWSDTAGQLAYDYADAGNYKLGIQYAVTAITHIRNGITEFLDLYNSDYQQSHFCESLYWANKDVAFSVDMEDILNAMIAADFDDLEHFIGYIDAYRVALWNAPFNVELYAAIARGFQKWPFP